MLFRSFNVPLKAPCLTFTPWVWSEAKAAAGAWATAANGSVDRLSAIAPAVIKRWIMASPEIRIFGLLSHALLRDCVRVWRGARRGSR